MVFKDYKTQAVEALINNFNAEHENEKFGGTITINDVSHCSTNSIELNNGLVCVERRIDNIIIITGAISVEDINDMYYTDEEYNIVSLDNIEF